MVEERAGKRTEFAHLWPTYWKPNWKSIENNNILKRIIKGLTGISTHSYEWVNAAVLVLLLGWMQTREVPYCAYHQPAIISSTIPSFPTAAKHSLLNKHKMKKGKPILPRKFKAKSTNNCFAVSALRCVYCKYYVAILLDKTKVENFLVYVPFQLQQWLHDQIFFVHPFLCLQNGANEALFVKDSGL